MKYEYLCGHVSDFFAMPENVIAVVRLDHCVQGLTEFNQITECGKPVLAMRRIIAEPKRWTWEDQKAGLLPEVGCRIYVPIMFEEQNVIYSSEKVIVSISDNGGAVTRTEVASINRIKPIESPEEKAQRLREEWCIKALSSCSILSGMQKYELKRLGGYIEDIYDALLSGDIPVPAAPEQNK